jgi:hypothetical protein
MATVMAAMATVITRARRSPSSELLPPPLPATVRTTPAKARRLAVSVRGVARSLNQIQAKPAATKGQLAKTMATSATLVSLRAGMKLVMPMVERQVTSSPGQPMARVTASVRVR